MVKQRKTLWNVLKADMGDILKQPEYLKTVKNKNDYKQVIKACEKQARDELIDTQYQ